MDHANEDQTLELIALELNLLSRLTRGRIIELLESASIACYDSESTETLLDALKVNVQDGTVLLDWNDVYGFGGKE